jgi:ribosomal protein S18 acetylase RimI-like enzyme
MKNKIEIKEGEIDIAIKVHLEMHEFSGFYRREEVEDRYEDKEKIILVAYLNGQPVGYMISYDKYRDGSFYCWMTGVEPDFRRKGVLTKMMDYLNDWAIKHNYESIKLKTRNNRREMLNYLIKNEFNMLNVETNPAVEDNKILFEKKLM